MTNNIVAVKWSMAIHILVEKRMQMKQALREMQTLRAGCSKAEPKNFTPSQTPFPGPRDGQNLIS